MSKPKAKKKTKKPWWKWWSEKDLTEAARGSVMSLPRNMGISRKQIASEVKKEKKKIAKKWRRDEFRVRDSPVALKKASDDLLGFLDLD